MFVTMANSVAEKDFLICCGSSKFAGEMVKLAPFLTLSQAIEASRNIWWNKVDVPGWLEAFASHPRIGDTESIKKPDSWSKSEQSAAIETANDSILQELADWNQRYEEKFGFRFLICASGKSSMEILKSLQARFSSRPIEELQVAAEEQQKITEIRLGKMFGEAGLAPVSQRLNQFLGHLGAAATVNESSTSALGHSIVPTQVSSTRPPITTHVLDVSRGRPGEGISVLLELWKGTSKAGNSNEWTMIGSSVTDSDGRCGPLMAPSNSVAPGRYKLTFDTGKYFQTSSGSEDSASQYFYPYVSVVFEIKPYQVSQHFHVPVLLSPFSYTTYRGS
ncbi:hypothetical protein KP509_1Z017300 [Ceratopteris richardii]|nr:hypothetical protein KP509_1Z017300 [Ceratopteris richardii]